MSSKLRRCTNVLDHLFVVYLVCSGGYVSDLLMLFKFMGLKDGARTFFRNVVVRHYASVSCRVISVGLTPEIR